MFCASVNTQGGTAATARPDAVAPFLRQHLAALAEQRVGLGALVCEKAGLLGHDHHVDIVGSWASLSLVTVT